MRPLAVLNTSAPLGAHLLQGQLVQCGEGAGVLDLLAWEDLKLMGQLRLPDVTGPWEAVAVSEDGQRVVVASASRWPPRAKRSAVTCSPRSSTCRAR